MGFYAFKFPIFHKKNHDFYLSLKFLSLLTMEIGTQQNVSKEILLKAFNHMMLAKAMADIY